MTQLALIVAMARNGVIGLDNGLPWHIPEDLRHFRELTMGKPMIMGRRTWESIDRPLPGRSSLVISRDPGYAAAGAEVFQDLDSALLRAGQLAAASGAGEIMIVGGAQIYAEALPRVTRLHVTEVHAEVAGDAWFPTLDWTSWREVRRVAHPPVDGRPGWAFVDYERAGEA